MRRQQKPVSNKREAVEAAIQALTLRALSEHEIENKLNKRNCPQEIILEVIQHLKTLGYLNDLKLAKSVFESLIQKGKCGRNGIVFKMRQRGIPESMIQETMQTFDPAQEMNSAIAVLRKKFPFCNKQDSLKICRFLAYKGFSSTVIRQILTQMDDDH